MPPQKWELQGIVMIWFRSVGIKYWHYQCMQPWIQWRLAKPDIPKNLLESKNFWDFKPTQCAVTFGWKWEVFTFEQVPWKTKFSKGLLKSKNFWDFHRLPFHREFSSAWDLSSSPHEFILSWAHSLTNSPASWAHPLMSSSPHEHIPLWVHTLMSSSPHEFAHSLPHPLMNSSPHEFISFINFINNDGINKVFSSWVPMISLGAHQNIRLHTGAHANVVLLT